MYAILQICSFQLEKGFEMSGIAHSLLHVHWLVPVGAYIIAAYVGVRWLAKHLANQPDQIKRITVNMAFCAAAGTVKGLAPAIRARNE